MRLLHISDLHFCETKLKDFEDYKGQLLEKLKELHQRKSFDFIFLTGDLVDKGGSRFKSPDECYYVFEREFINFLAENLQIEKRRFYFIPGNHDVDESLITEAEGGMANYDLHGINKFIREHRNSYTEGNKRIERFKKFEEAYYKNIKHSNFQVTPFESCWIEEFDGIKIGIAGLNSGWRCSTGLRKESLYLGTEQIIHVGEFFRRNKTDFNIALLHHPIELFAEQERNEIETYLVKKANIHFLLGGHTHKNDVRCEIKQAGALVNTIARTGFTDKREKDEVYQAGFIVVDIIHNYLFQNDIEFRHSFYKYVHSHLHYDFDPIGGEGGRWSVRLDRKHFSEKFKGYLQESRSNDIIDGSSLTDAQKIIREDLKNLWDKLTKSLIETSFVNISDKLSGLIREKVLPKKLDFYIKDRNFNYEIRDFDENHFELTETQTYRIISNKEAFLFTKNFFVEKLQDENDKSEIAVEKLVINGKCYKDKVKSHSPACEDPRTIRTEIEIEFPLSGNIEYNVEIKIRSVHTHYLNGYWRAFIKEITEGLSVNMPEDKNYEIDIVNFSKNMDISKGFIPLQKKEDTTSEVFKPEDKLFMPGDGFVLIIKRKNI